jgi:hypothetical protein
LALVKTDTYLTKRVVLIVLIYFYRDEGSEGHERPEDYDPTKAGEVLAPHGVPSAPIPRALSSARLEEQEETEAMMPSGPNLGVPGMQVKYKCLLFQN